MIDILVPVLGRPQNAQPLVDSIRANTTVPHSILFLTSPGDQAEFTACCLTGANVLEVPTTTGGNYAAKINAGFRETIYPFVFCAADDIEFTPEWDTTALAVAKASGRGVIGTNDMANTNVMNGLFSTHPLVRRSYILDKGGSLDGPGVVYSETYDHNYPDRELACLAQYRNEWVFAIESKVIHHHAGHMKGADATYRKGARRFRQDHIRFLQRSHHWDYVGLTAQEAAAVKRRTRLR